MLAFIEGSMERQFVNANFKYVRVVPVQNGISWTPERLCERIITVYLALNYHGTVIAWLDREGRDLSAHELRQLIIDALVAAGANPADVHVLINDRMSENIILADEDVIRTEFNSPAFSYSHEGQNGKHVLKGMYQAISVNYKETVQGVRLLKRIRLVNSATCSPSVASFVAGFNPYCWWIHGP